MRRIIKFRAWHRNKKKFLLAGDLHNLSNVPAISHGDHFELDQNNVDYLQFTGIKDKNGKDVCEADLLKDQYGFLWEVFWTEKSARFILVSRDEDISPDRYFGDRPEVNYEIIGNIFENLSLLSPKKSEEA